MLNLFQHVYPFALVFYPNFVPSPRERARERGQYKAVQLEILRSAQYDEPVKSLSNPIIASVCEAIQLNPQCRRGNADLHNS